MQVYSKFLDEYYFYIIKQTINLFKYQKYIMRITNTNIDFKKKG